MLQSKNVKGKAWPKIIYNLGFQELIFQDNQKGKSKAHMSVQA